MRPEADVRRVFELWEQGLSKSAIARQTGVSRAQVRSWVEAGIDLVLHSPMRERIGSDGGVGPCDGTCEMPARVDEIAYAYLLGQYLGDGCISAGPRGVYKMRITACDDYPHVQDECAFAMRLAMPGRRVGFVQRAGCTDVTMHSKHWPCLFPQHGPGMKHTRPIILQSWQAYIALDRHTNWFVRGLIHSDGWRGMNTVKAKGDPTRRYRYPRYQFSNRSADIRGLFVSACERLDIPSRQSNAWTISVSRREAVAKLDEFVGPKR